MRESDERWIYRSGSRPSRRRLSPDRTGAQSSGHVHVCRRENWAPSARIPGKAWSGMAMQFSRLHTSLELRVLAPKPEQLERVRARERARESDEMGRTSASQVMGSNPGANPRGDDGIDGSLGLLSTTKPRSSSVRPSRQRRARDRGARFLCGLPPPTIIPQSKVLLGSPTQETRVFRSAPRNVSALGGLRDRDQKPAPQNYRLRANSPPDTQYRFTDDFFLLRTVHACRGLHYQTAI